MKGMAVGMGAVMRRFLTPSVNERYPDRKKTLPPRSRISFELPRSEAGDVNCKSCGLCAKNCPDNAITIESVKREDGPGRELQRFVIDLGVCMYCGLCVENCPSDGIRFTQNFEASTPSRSGTLLVLQQSPGAGVAGTAPAAAEPTCRRSGGEVGGDAAPAPTAGGGESS